MQGLSLLRRALASTAAAIPTTATSTSTTTATAAAAAAARPTPKLRALNPSRGMGTHASPPPGDMPLNGMASRHVHTGGNAAAAQLAELLDREVRRCLYRAMIDALWFDVGGL